MSTLAGMFSPGDRVEVQDAHGKWLPATVLTFREAGHKFPIYWVTVDGIDDRIPWPIEYVRRADEA